MSDCTRCGRPAGAHAIGRDATPKPETDPSLVSRDRSVPTYATPMLASRTTKARRTNGSVCGLCRTVIIQGQQIGLVPGRGWLHAACIIRRQPMIGPHSGA